jgi:hypothetical protein
MLDQQSLQIVEAESAPLINYSVEDMHTENGSHGRWLCVLASVCCHDCKDQASDRKNVSLHFVLVHGASVPEQTMLLKGQSHSQPYTSH